MEVHIYSVKVKSQAGNINNVNTKRPAPKENEPGILGISSREFTHYVQSSAEGLGSSRECCWGLRIYLQEFLFNLLVCSIYFCLIFVYFVGVIICKVYNI